MHPQASGLRRARAAQELGTVLLASLPPGWASAIHCADEAGARTRGLASADILRGFAFAVTRVIMGLQFFLCRLGLGTATVGDFRVLFFLWPGLFLASHVTTDAT